MLLNHAPARPRLRLAQTILALTVFAFVSAAPALAETEKPALSAETPQTAQTPPTPAAPITDEAQRIYEAYGDAVYQIRVIDLTTGEKNGIGSGFQIDAQGLLATNYHVVAEAVQRPEKNRLEYISEKGGKGALTVLAADVINDLALLKMDKPGKTYVTPGTSAQAKGSRLFSLGNPHDISFTIVEGTFNGLSSESLFEKIHFSGALNPGMSGGPALGHDGRVVGINVATAGNQIGFLVPVEALRRLLSTYKSRTESEDFTKNAHSLIEAQLLQSQQKNLNRILSAPWEKIPLGPVLVPGRLDPAFKCWGNSVSSETDLYLHSRTDCSSEDQVFLDNDLSSGTFNYSYDLLRPKSELHTARFYSYYGQVHQWSEPGYRYRGDKQDFTGSDCNDSFVTLAGRKWLASFCLRRYRKYPGVHDMQLFLALVDRQRLGMRISLAAQGLSRDGALALTRRFMESVAPNPQAAPLPPPAAPKVPPTATPKVTP